MHVHTMTKLCRNKIIEIVTEYSQHRKLWGFVLHKHYEIWQTACH
jgi:hypothetical protein